MKIGITCYPTYGGSGIVGSELGKELAARGQGPVTLIGSSLGGALAILAANWLFPSKAKIDAFVP